MESARKGMHITTGEGLTPMENADGHLNRVRGIKIYFSA